MSESNPPPETAAPTPEPSPAPAPDTAAKAERRKCNWHRVRVYSLSILIMITMWFCAIMLEIRYHPLVMVNRALARLPFASSAGDAHWVNRRTLKVDYVRIGDFFYADSLIITASPFGLWRHHLAKVQVIGAQLYAQQLVDTLKANPAAPPTGNWSPGKILNDVGAS